MGDVLHSYNPATLEEVGYVETVTVDDLPGIIERSRSVQKEWAKVSPKDRAALFKRLMQVISDDAEDIAYLAGLETGKPKTEALNTETLVSIAFAKYCEKWLKRFKFEKKVPMEPMSLIMRFLGKRSVSVYRPAGIVLVISPYNYPFCIPFTETAAAVAAGNSVILKPSPDTPLCAELMMKEFEKAGFPKGLVQCINGDGVAEALTASDSVQRIQFTGSTRTGKIIMDSASKNLIPVTLELGGCDPFIVLRDADMERALRSAVWGAFCNAGQVCVGVQRILVQRELYDVFVERFVKMTQEIRIGFDWDDPEISMGPVINENMMNKVLDQIDDCVKAGGRILCGGKRAEGLKGWFIEPTVMTGIPVDSLIYNEEIFGPFVSITPFDSDDEAIAIANSSPYALGGSVWSKDLGHARAVADGIDSEIITLNNVLYLYGVPSAPWGGKKGSGFGKSHGEEGFLALMDVQHINYDKGMFSRELWNMPYTEESSEAMEEMPKALFTQRSKMFGFFGRALRLYRKKD